MAANRIIAIVFLIGFSRLFAQSTDEQKISISFTDAEITEALLALDRITDKQLSYNPQILPKDQLINQSFDNETLSSILKKILGPSYNLKFIGNYTIIQPSVSSKKTSFEIKGGIRDAQTGEALEDVSVYEINSLQSTLSDGAGDFELKATPKLEVATFVISKKFYEDTVIHLNSKNELSGPFVLRQEQSPPRKKPQISKSVKNFSDKMVKFFTSIELRKNARNVNFVDTRKFQLSLVPSIGTNRKLSTQIENKISVNIIAGHSYGVRGVELGGFYNIDREEVNGVQIGGFGNSVGGKVEGLQAAGFLNASKSHVKGTQLTGFLNLASDSVNGFQAAGFTNITKEMTGFQLAGFNNHVKKFSGFQLSGFINTTKTIQGLQMSGFINIAKEVRGVQISIINISDTVSNGSTIGLINVIKKGGFISPAIEYDDVLPYQFVIRTGLEKFYSLMFIGTNPGNHWAVGGGFGTRRYTSSENRFFLNPEIRWISLAKGRFDENEDNNMVRLNLNIGYKWFKRLSVTGGPSVNFFFTNHLDESDRPVLELANSPILEGRTANKRYQLWVGYSFGVNF